MTEERESILNIFQTIMNNAAELTDIALTGFIIIRNLKTGANTITESGLTSPNSGVLQNWPAIDVNKDGNGNGVNASRGHPDGSVTGL